MATVADHISAHAADIEAIEAAALDYLLGYIGADPQRHIGAYHPEAIKRRFTKDSDGIFGLATISPTTMADFAATEDPADDPTVEVFIDDVVDDIASVRVYSQRWIDFLHVVKARGAWKLFHVTWYRRPNE